MASSAAFEAEDTHARIHRNGHMRSSANGSSFPTEELMTYHTTASPSQGQRSVHEFGGAGGGYHTYAAVGTDSGFNGRSHDFSCNNYSSGDVSYRGETWGHGSSFAASTPRSLSPSQPTSIIMPTVMGHRGGSTSLGSTVRNTTNSGRQARPLLRREKLASSIGSIMDFKSDRPVARLDFKLPASFVPETSWLLETMPVPTLSSRPLGQAGGSGTGRHSLSAASSRMVSAAGKGESTTSIISGRTTKFTRKGDLYNQSRESHSGGESIQFAHPIWPSKLPSSRQETILLRRWFREKQSALHLQSTPKSTQALLNPSLLERSSSMSLPARRIGRQTDSPIADRVQDQQQEATEGLKAVSEGEGWRPDVAYYHRNEDGDVVREVAKSGGNGHGRPREGDGRVSVPSLQSLVSGELGGDDDKKARDYHEALEKTCALRELYAIAFHELSRQVSAHCAERGTFMNELWMNYTACLDEQLEILKRQRNAAMERESVLKERVAAFDVARAEDRNSGKLEMQRKDMEISILRTQLEDEKQIREDLEKERNKKSGGSAGGSARASSDGGHSVHYGGRTTNSSGDRYDNRESARNAGFDGSNRSSVISMAGDGELGHGHVRLSADQGKRRRSSLYMVPQTSHSHEIEKLTTELESAGMRATEYRDQLDKVQTNYEKMEIGILQLESQLAASEHRAENAESDRSLLQQECERLRDEARVLTPRPARLLHEDFDCLDEDQQSYVREVIDSTALVKDGIDIAKRILLGKMVQELNLDKASFDRFWGYMVVDSGGGGGTNGAEGRPGSSSGGRRLKQRKNRRSISMNHVKDLIDARIKEKAAGVEAHIKDNDDELELRYGKEMAQFIYEVVGSSDATGDDVLACMMGLIPGLGEAAPLIRKQCFGCLEDLISEEALHAALEYSMRTTRERLDYDSDTIAGLKTELRKMVAWKEEVDRLAAEKNEKRQKYIEIKEKSEKSPMDIFLETDWQDTFIGLGIGQDVPKYMRTNSKIRNRNMTKRETEKTVKEIWAEKRTADKKENTVTELSSFMPLFFQKKMGLPAAVTEMTYNFMFSLKKYDYDADCELFMRIVLGQIKEEVYHEQLKLCSAVEDVFRQIDIACNTEAKGFLYKDDAKQALRTFFDEKTEERMEELLEALNEVNPANKVEYMSLFEEDREFNQGPFAECIRDQFLEERLEQFENLEKELYDLSNYENECTMEQLESAMQAVFGVVKKNAITTAMRGKEVAEITEVMASLRKGVISRDHGEGGGDSAGGAQTSGADKVGSSAAVMRKVVQTVRAGNKIARRPKQSQLVRRASMAVDSVRQAWMMKELSGSKKLETHRDSTREGRPLLVDTSLVKKTPATPGTLQSPQSSSSSSSMPSGGRTPPGSRRGVRFAVGLEEVKEFEADEEEMEGESSGDEDETRAIGADEDVEKEEDPEEKEEEEDGGQQHEENKREDEERERASPQDDDGANNESPASAQCVDADNPAPVPDESAGAVLASSVGKADEQDAPGGGGGDGAGVPSADQEPAP